MLNIMVKDTLPLSEKEKKDIILALTVLEDCSKRLTPGLVGHFRSCFVEYTNMLKNILTIPNNK